MRKAYAIAIGALSMLPWSRAVSQAFITGSITVRETGAPIGYTIVSIPAIGFKQFSTERGTYMLRYVPAGRVAVQFKRIGSVPLDTVVTVRDGDTLRVDVKLATLAIKLPTVRVSGACGTKRPDPSVALVLDALFDQVTQNAEQYRLLTEANPFVMVMRRTQGARSGNNIRSPFVDTIPQPGLSPTPYAPHRAIRMLGASGRLRPVLTVPELTDFADTAFVNNHCFTYAGTDTIDRVPVVVVEYEPVPALDTAADFRGKIFVTAAGYRLVRSEMELTRVPRSLNLSGISGFHSETIFREIMPGVTIIDRIEATTERRGAPGAAERQQVVGVRWGKGVECLTSATGCDGDPPLVTGDGAGLAADSIRARELAQLLAPADTAIDPRLPAVVFPPTVPEEMRVAGKQGRVLFMFIVDSLGFVDPGSRTVLFSDGPRFTESACFWVASLQMTWPAAGARRVVLLPLVLSLPQPDYPRVPPINAQPARAMLLGMSVPDRERWLVGKPGCPT